MYKRFAALITGLIALALPLSALAISPTQSFQNIVPFTTDKFDNGTSTLEWLHLFTKFASTTQLTVTGSAWLKGITGATQCLHVDTNGLITGTGVDCGSSGGGVTAVTGTYPVISSGGTTPAISLAFGTTTSNTWAGTQTFTNAPIVAALTGLISGNAGLLYQTATSTLSASSPLTGSFVQVGTGGSLGCQTASGSQAGCLSSADWTTFNSKLSNAITAIGPAGQAQTGATVTLASSTSSFNGLTVGTTIVGTGNTLTWTPSLSGTLTVAGGGTGQTTFTGSQLLYGAGSGALQSVATSSASCSSGVSCSGFTVVGSVSPSITNTGVLSLAQSFGSAQTGAINIATSTVVANGQTIGVKVTNSAGTFTFVPTISGTLDNTGLTSSTISGKALGTSLSTLSATDSTLTFSAAYDGSTARTVGINLGNANTWSALQQFTGNASSSQETVTGNAYLNSSSGLTGIGSTSPYAQLGVTSPAGVVPFAIGSSTGSLFAVTDYGSIQASAVQPATTTTITLDWSKTPSQVEYRLGTSATTITLINATTSQWWGSRKMVWICNPGATAGALTWAGVEWIGTAPTQTTTANQCDAYSFDITHATSTSAYKVGGTAGSGFQ